MALCKACILLKARLRLIANRSIEEQVVCALQYTQAELPISLQLAPWWCCMQAVSLKLLPGTSRRGSVATRKLPNIECILVHYVCLARTKCTFMGVHVGGDVGARNQMKHIYVGWNIGHRGLRFGLGWMILRSDPVLPAHPMMMPTIGSVCGVALVGFSSSHSCCRGLLIYELVSLGIPRAQR